MKKNWLFREGDEILPSYVGTTINHYKDPYQSTSIMESIRVFFFVAHRFFWVMFISQGEGLTFISAPTATGMENTCSLSLGRNTRPGSSEGWAVLADHYI